MGFILVFLYFNLFILVSCYLKNVLYHSFVIALGPQKRVMQPKTKYGGALTNKFDDDLNSFALPTASVGLPRDKKKEFGRLFELLQ